MAFLSGSQTPAWKRVCIFLDGENFRFSLADLFRSGKFDFQKRDYLPDTDWTEFFRSLYSDRSGWELVRVYWYVTREIDYWPSRIPFEWEKKRAFLQRCNIVDALTDQGCEDVGTESNTQMRAIEGVLEQRKREIRKRSEGWRTVHTSIEHKNNQIEFRSTGSIRYDLVKRAFGQEKGVDTQLATDLITLSDIYDVALVVSGDADYIPPVQAIKRRGKLVYSVSFLTEEGRKLPGGAHRLERIVDGRIELPFASVRNKLGIRELADGENRRGRSRKR